MKDYFQPLHRTLLVGAAAVVGACSLLVGQAAPVAPSPGGQGTASPAAPSSSPANASPAAPSSSPANASSSAPLRALGATVGLRIGSAVNPSALASGRDDSIIAEQFSVVTSENAMKWKRVEPTRGRYDWRNADRLVAFAQAHGQLVRGHTLVWQRSLPSWLTRGVADGTISNGQLRSLLKQHIQDEVGHFKGRIWQWDVVNEAFTDTGRGHPGSTPGRFWVDHLGAGVLADAFRWAHAADPRALLFYNDYRIETVDAKSTAILDWAKRMKAQGVPIDGVGFQTHLDAQYRAPKGSTANLQRFADAGFKVAITEADVRTFTRPGAVNTPAHPDGVRAQAATWKQTIDSCLAVQACISYTVWGVTDDQSWVPSAFTHPQEGAALLWDERRRPKTQYFAVAHELATVKAPHR